MVIGGIVLVAAATLALAIAGAATDLEPTSNLRKIDHALKLAIVLFPVLLGAGIIAVAKVLP